MSVRARGRVPPSARPFAVRKPASVAGLCLFFLAALTWWTSPGPGFQPRWYTGLLSSVLDAELGLASPRRADGRADIRPALVPLMLEPGLAIDWARAVPRPEPDTAAEPDETAVSVPEKVVNIPTPPAAAPRTDGRAAEDGGPYEAEPPPPAPEAEPPARAVEVTLTAGTGANFLRSGNVVIRNETSVNVNMDRVMSRKLAITLPKGKPQILILHTHAHEAYLTYDQDGVTVADIGARLAERLTGQGFEVIHDTTQYNLPDFNKAYSSALAGITKTLKEHPSIQVVLDVHRDAIQPAGDMPRKPVADTESGKAAQMMFVVGTNNSGLPHDNWPQNLCLAVKLQKLLAESAPDLMRPINLRRERFNQHATYGSLILEVGSYGNDSTEAFRAIDIFADKAGELFAGLVQ